MTFFSGFSQEPTKDFYLKKSLKQDGFQYQFTVLEEDKRGVWHYDKSKFYFWYKAQKVLATQGGASGDLLNGDFVAFHENKQLAQKGRFCKGLKDGKWMYWRTDGTLIMIEYWKKGSASGTKELFNENGESTETIKHARFKSTRTVSDSVIVRKNNGKLETVYLKDENGNVIGKKVYKKGVLQVEETKKVKESKSGQQEESSKRRRTEPAEVKEESSSKKESFFKRIFKKKSTEKSKEKETKPKRPN